MAKILITGGLGFIGSHLALSFDNMGHEVLLIDNLSRRTPNILPQFANNRFNLSYFRCFASLMLAYLGSKLVLEIILQKV